ncbi:hypothetical protein FACS1894182_03070 [Bacteroidia bacterium]|nr:hypothetical protein FACS1894182_03070 [Bacteroidia bacterium]
MKKFLFILLGICLTSSLSLFAQQEKKEKGAVMETLTPEMYVDVATNILYIKNAPIGAKLQIITIVGSKVREIEIHSREVAYELNLPKAIYIFKLEGIVRKVVIK